MFVRKKWVAVTSGRTLDRASAATVSASVLFSALMAVGIADVHAQALPEAPAAEAPAEETAPVPTAEAVAESDVEEVIVTGSRIARSGYDTPTPVTVIGEEDLQSSASANLADFINDLPSVAGSTTPATSNRSLSSGAAGINSVNLRGLGNARTLVLLDGRRSVGSLAQGTVDINTFPQGLVKSIEIVTGGASSTYGSDAVSGVANFILDRKYTGFKGSIEGGETTYGDDRSWTATLTGGVPFADGRGHFLFNGEMARRDGIYGVGDRGWANDGWHMVNNPAYLPGNGQPEYVVSNQSGLNNLTGGGIITNTALRGTYFGPGGVINHYNYGDNRVAGNTSAWTIGGDWEQSQHNHLTSLQPEEQRDGLFGRLSFDLADNLQIFGEASWNQSQAQQWGGQQTDKGNITIRTDNAFIPDGLDTTGITQFTMGSWNADIPTRESDNERTVQRYVLGLEGSFDLFNAGWKWDTYYQKGVTDAHESLYSANTKKLGFAQDAVYDDNGNIVCRVTRDGSTDAAAAGCVPFNRMGIGVNAPGAYDYFMGTPWRDQKFEQDVAALNFSTNIANPWLDPIGVAFGAEHRREEISGYVEDQYNSGWIVGNFLPTFGDYEVTEGYLELLVPLPGRVEFNGAARGTDYSTSGFVTTWKTGLTWSPIDDLKLRATKSRDIRAPNLAELYQAGTRNTNSVTDPRTGNPRRYTQDTTGNPDLKPEEADSLGLGLVYRPSFIPGLGLSLDYYDIKIDDAIASITPQDIVDRCYERELQEYCSRITGGAETDPTSTNEFYIANSPFNFVGQRTRGLDLEATYVFPLSSIIDDWAGEMSLRALATHYLEMSSNNSVDPETDLVGQNTSGGPPDWMYRLSAAYKLDRFNFILTGRGISSGTYDNTYVECTSDCPASSSLSRTINTNHIAGALYFDTYFSYDLDWGNWKNQIFFKINNVANKDPEPVGLGPGDSSNVEPGINRALYDYLGRTFRLGMRFDWGG